LPLEERTALATAISTGDTRARKRYEKRGRRRKQFQANLLCVYRESDRVVLGFIPRVRFLPGTLERAQALDSPEAKARPDCRCLVRALDDDELTDWIVQSNDRLTVERGGNYYGRGFPRLRIREAAKRFHADPNLTTKTLIEELEAEIANVERKKLERESAQLHSDLDRFDLADKLSADPAPVRPAPKPRPRVSVRPVERTPKWFDNDDEWRSIMDFRF
jgi:hypothetical protein